MTKDFAYTLKYIIETGNIEMFDLLTKDWDKIEKEDKEFIIVHTVAEAVDVDFIKHVISLGYDINWKDKEDNTLLHFAATSSCPETVRFFIDKGLSLEARNKYEETPLVVAAKESDNPEVLQTLIDAGADIHVLSNGGENLLISAAGFNTEPSIINFLLKKGFDIEDRDSEGCTPLLNAAAWQSNPDVISALLDAGADLHAKTKNGDNLFHLAAYNSDPDAARTFGDIFFTSDVNNEGTTCFQTVLQNGKKPEIMRIYLRKMKEEQVFYACSNEHPEILETLIQSGYDANTTNCEGVTALMMAAKINTNPDIIRMLRFYKACIEAHDDDGRNLVHYAACNTDQTIYNWMQNQDDFKKLADEEDSKGHKPVYYRSHPDEF